MPRCRQCQHALARPPHVWYRLLSRQGRLSLSCAPPTGRVPRAGLVSHRVAKHMFVYSICDVRLDSAVQAAAWTCTCPLLVHVCMLQWQSSGQLAVELAGHMHCHACLQAALPLWCLLPWLQQPPPGSVPAGDTGGLGVGMPSTDLWTVMQVGTGQLAVEMKCA